MNIKKVPPDFFFSLMQYRRKVAGENLLELKRKKSAFNVGVYDFKRQLNAAAVF